VVRNPFAPPAARLEDRSESRVLVPVIVGLLGGMASWLAAGKLSAWSFPNVWHPYSMAGYSMPTLIRVILPFVLVYAVSGTVLALSRAKPWWTPWPALMAGTIAWIVGHALFVPVQGLRYAFGVLSRDIFWAALFTGSAFFLLISYWRRSRSAK